ncbi:MAG: hypothetical protein ACPGU4_09160 [Flavobacteriales bacterium]
MKRATKGEIENRVGQIATMLINGESKTNVVRFSTENFGVKERMTEKYLVKAKELIEKSVKKEVEYDYSLAVSRYSELYKRSFEKKDFKTCLSINKELSALQGLHKVQVEHSGNIQFVSSVPD